MTKERFATIMDARVNGFSLAIPCVAQGGGLNPKNKDVRFVNNLLVIGSLNMDMVIHVEAIPKVGETLMGDLHAYIPGGKGANQACAGARLGERVAMLGRVGEDSFAKTLLESLEAAGTDISPIGHVAGSSGLAVICVSRKGENNIVVIPGANAQCTPEVIRENEALIMQSKVILLQMEIPHEAVYEAVRIAKKHGRIVVLNPAPAPDAIPEEILQKIDYLVPNETELEHLSGQRVTDNQSAQQAAQVLLEKGVGNVVATLGATGAMYCGGGRAYLSPGLRVKAVDTTAAGDTFCAAFALGLAQEKAMEENLAFANAAAALSVTRAGAQPSIPSRQETLDFMERMCNR